MQMKLEVVLLPVADVDCAKALYVDKLGFDLDHDAQPGNGMRVVQVTPPGSACSVVLGTGIGEIDQIRPGSIKGLHLVVADAEAAREMLLSQGVAVGEVQEHGQGIKYVGFSDPDGNS